MAKNIREERVTGFMNATHSGAWDLKVYSKDGQDVRIARAVVQSFGFKVTKTTLDGYVSTVRDMLASGALEYSLGRFSGSWMVKVA